MAGTFNIKQNDTLPPIRETLMQSGQPINLTGTTVEFHLRAQNNQIKVSANASIIDPTNGIVQYNWSAADTDTAGNFEREWEITYPSGGGILTVPNDTPGYPVVITDDLA